MKDIAKIGVLRPFDRRGCEIYGLMVNARTMDRRYYKKNINQL